MATYERLKAWQSCHQLALAVYAALNVGRVRSYSA
jgi:hypothetical protein